MTNIAPRVGALAVAAGVVLSGCVQTTAGRPVRAQGAGPNVATLSESALDQILLTVSDVSAIVGGSGLQISNSAEDLADSAEVVDKVECLGVIFAAEREVYQGSGWKAVRDQIIREPGDDKQHWVEQTGVLFSSAHEADNFLAKSRDDWADCADTSITTRGSDDTSYHWNIGQVSEPSDTEITIDMEQENSSNWACQHAMGAVSNVIVEAVVCGHGINDEGEEVVTRIAKNAANQ